MPPTGVGELKCDLEVSHLDFSTVVRRQIHAFQLPGMHFEGLGLGLACTANNMHRSIRGGGIVPLSFQVSKSPALHILLTFLFTFV